MSARWTPTDNQRLYDLRAAGASLDEMAQALTRTYAAVAYHCTIIGAPYAKRPWMEREKRILRQMVARGCSMAEIERALSRRTRGAIRVYLARGGAK